MSEKLQTGPITHDEARQILARFNASHWNDGREKARYTIPADPNRDDDVRMDAYIDQCAAQSAELARVRAEAERLREELERANRPWSVRLSVPDAVDHYRHLPCRLIDTGHSDRILIVECPELAADIARAALKEHKG